jgi:putative membrane protein
VIWTPPPAVLAGLLGLEIGYLLCVGAWRHRFVASDGGPVPRVGRGRQMLFLAGVLGLGLALASPLEPLVAYLQSAHMVQHLLLTIVAPPLLLLGTPGWLLRPALAWPGVAPVARLVTRARLAFALGNVTFLVWHFPAFYDAALRYEPVHILEHLSLLTTALILWWPLLGSLSEFPRLAYPLQMLYVFLQTLPGALLGIILGMAPVPLYPSYEAAPRLWGLSVMADQQISGLIMWVGTNLFWPGILTTIFFVWAAHEEADGLGGPKRSPAPGN